MSTVPVLLAMQGRSQKGRRFAPQQPTGWVAFRSTAHEHCVTPGADWLISVWLPCAVQFNARAVAWGAPAARGRCCRRFSQLGAAAWRGAAPADVNR